MDFMHDMNSLGQASRSDGRRKPFGRLWAAARRHDDIMALVAFGFLGPQGHAGAKVGLLLLLLAALARWRRLVRDLARDPFVLAWCLLAFYLLIRAALAAGQFPATSSEQWSSAFELAAVGFSVALVSWCLAADPKRVMLLLAAALAGFAVEMVVELDPGRLNGLAALPPRRLVGSPLPVGLAGAIAIAGLLAFLPRLVSTARELSRRRKLILFSALSLVATLLMLVQVVTRSRAVFGMLLVVVPLMLVWQARRRRRGTRERLPTLGIHVVVIGLFAGAVALIGPRLADKVERGYDRVAPYVVSGNLEAMPPSSFGWRVHLNVHGGHLFSERPWIGWGPGTSATRDLGERYQPADLTTRAHLHNTYLEILVRLGAAGALLYLVAAGLLLRAAIRARRGTGRMPGDVGGFLAAGGAMVAGYCLIGFRLVTWDFLFPLILLASLAHTFGAGWAASHPGRESC